MNKILIISITLFLYFGCSERELNSEQASIENMQEVSESSSASDVATQSSSVDTRKVIWTASLEFQVKDVDKSTKSINTLAKKHNAFVSDMDLSSTPYRISNTIELRVKSDQFDSLINDIKGESIFMQNIKINSQDVTEEFIDIQSRLNTKKEVRERYIDILRNKTGSIKDVIEAEEAIRKITEEIEAKEGRLRYLSDKVNFSTITLTIYQEVEYNKVPNVYIKPYSEKLVEAFGNGWGIVTNLILGLINIWPIVIIIGLFFWKRALIKSWFKGK